MNSERWQDHSEPSEWVNYQAVWLTCTIENKPSLDNDQHSLSPWMNAPQIAVFTVFVIRTPGQRCKATHQCCSSGTGWLCRAGIPYPRVLLCSISGVGWSWGESVGLTRLWDTLNPITAHPRGSQLCCAAAVVFLLSTVGHGFPPEHCRQSHPPGYLYGLKNWWYEMCAQVDLDGLLPFIPRGRTMLKKFLLI